LLHILLTFVYPYSSADPCARIDCGAHGSCSGGTCTCESGAYVGPRCDTCAWTGDSKAGVCYGETTIR
jgi:hypothetical protein